MALPVWLWPLTKNVGMFVFTNRHQLVDFGKKYGPPILHGYRAHGLKPRKIVTFVRTELANPPAGKVPGESNKAKAKSNGKRRKPKQV